MPKHLNPPVGEPDPGAAEIIAAIETYRDSSRSPATIVRGLRHIYWAAEHAWDASLIAARKSLTYAEITAATGDVIGTIQGRIRARTRRIYEEKIHAQEGRTRKP